MPLPPTALEPHRAALTGHCYRMLGCPAEAEDAVQETMIRAWRALDRFEARASLRTWLLRIATRVCLDQIHARGRRARPMDLGPAGTVEAGLGPPLPEGTFVMPIPDAAAIPSDADPAEQALLRESIRLAFVAALQRLPPRQRAVLLHREVLGASAEETAEALGMTVAAVNSALQRARATLDRSPPAPAAALTDAQVAQVARYVAAFERYDMDALTAVLHEEAALCMPPYALWVSGPASIRAFMLGPGAACRGSRFVPVAANGLPAFGQYKPGPDGFEPWSLVVLELRGDRVATVHHFLDTAALFPRFGLPSRLA